MALPQLPHCGVYARSVDVRGPAAVFDCRLGLWARLEGDRCRSRVLGLGDDRGESIGFAVIRPLRVIALGVAPVPAALVVALPGFGAAVAAAGGTAACAVRSEACGVGEGDGCVVGVGVAVERFVIGGGEDRIDGEEAADLGVVFAGADVGEAGCYIGRFAEECLVVGPRGGNGPAGVAEGFGVAAGDGLGGGVYDHVGGAVMVVDDPAEAGVGA